MIAVLLADDDLLVRSGLRALVDAEPDLTMGETVDGRQAVDRARALQPDVILMDVRCPASTGWAPLGKWCPGPGAHGCWS